MPGLLTRRQCWRRQPASQRSSLPLEIQSIESGLSRSLSESAVVSSTRPSQSLGVGPQWATTGNLLDSHTPALPASNLSFKKSKKSVLFSSRVNVVLIPCVAEYESAGLAPLLWWTNDDYGLFKQFALEEVREFMLQSNITDAKQAIALLYQGCHRQSLCADESRVGVVAEVVECTSELSADAPIDTDCTSESKPIDSSKLNAMLRTLSVTGSTPPNGTAQSGNVAGNGDDAARYSSRRLSRYLMNK